MSHLERECLAWVARGCSGEWTGAHLDCLRRLAKRGLLERRRNHQLQPGEAGNALYLLTDAGREALGK